MDGRGLAATATTAIFELALNIGFAELVAGMLLIFVLAAFSTTFTPSRSGDKRPLAKMFSWPIWLFRHLSRDHRDASSSSGRTRPGFAHIHDRGGGIRTISPDRGRALNDDFNDQAVSSRCGVCSIPAKA